jgi:hypothetical protein
MHATFQDLLTLRDGMPVDAEFKQHVSQCADCNRELTQLVALKEGLRQLPACEPPARAWNAIHAEVNRQSPRRPSRAPFAAFAATVLIAVLVLPLMHRTLGSHSSNPVVSATQAPATASQDSVGVLVKRSQRLEAVLQVLPPRPQVERAGTSATIDELQNRIQFLDLQLSANSAGELQRDDAQRLWGARVELMNSLVKVRYAQAAGNADLSESSNNLGAI